ncbi:MAG: hypothetical protein K9I94_08645 [Bacteroidales bacterium]|nr:hypothetical protein [Bacteroidales bacterium]
MKSWRTVFVVLIVLILLGGLGGGGYYLYFKAQEPYTPAAKAIPESAILVFETNNALELMQNLQGREFWKNLRNIDEIERIDRVLLSIDTTLRKESKIRDILETRNLFLSLHQVSTNRFDVLFSINISDAAGKNGVTNLISKGLGNSYEIIKAQANSITTYKVIHKQTGSVFNYAVKKGVFVCSFSVDLIVRAMAHLDGEETLESSQAYKKVIKTAGNKVNGNLYINYEALAPFIKSLSAKSIDQAIIDRFARTSSLDLTLKDKKLFLSGFTFAGDSTEKFLVNLKNSPKEQDLVGYLPSQTCWFLKYHFDPEAYRNHRQEFLKTNGDYNHYRKQLSTLEANYGSDPVKALSPISSGNAIISTWHKGTGQQLQNVAIIGIENRRAARRWINRYGRLIRHDIYKLPENTLPLLFGEPFGELKNAYGIITDKILLISESYENVKQLYGLINREQTLNREQHFKNYQENTMNDAAVHFYANLHFAGAIFNEYLEEELAKTLEDYLPALDNYIFSMEYAPNQDLYYSNLCICYSQAKQTDEAYDWSAELKTNIDKGPYLVRDHTTGKLKILVFDELHQMHMIDHLGNLKWTVPLAGNVISDVLVVDYYKNGKFQYLFNTNEFIYLIDLEGNKVADYPIKLKTKATNGVSVLHYRDINSRRILLALKDKKVYNYYLEGKPVRGWHKPALDSRVNYPVQHVIAGNRDYIIIPQSNNNIKIVNRRGATRISMKSDFLNALNSPFYENNTNSKGIMITTDVNGKLTYIKRSGNIQKTDFGEFTAGHYFRYVDMDNDNSEDFVYLDGDRLIAFDRFKNVIVEHRFQSPIINAPLFRENTPYGNILAVMDNQHEYVQLFNKSGAMFPRLEFKANTGMALGNLNNDDKLHLVTSYRNKVLVYSLN